MLKRSRLRRLARCRLPDARAWQISAALAEEVDPQVVRRVLRAAGIAPLDRRQLPAPFRSTSPGPILPGWLPSIPRRAAPRSPRRWTARACRCTKRCGPPASRGASGPEDRFGRSTRRWRRASSRNRRGLRTRRSSGMWLGSCRQSIARCTAASANSCMGSMSNASATS